MKLAIVCRPWSFHGGVETATAGLVRELTRRGHDIDLISTRGQPDVPRVRVRRVPTVDQPSVIRLLSFALAARRAASAGAYDIVQSHERVLGQDVYRAGEGTHRGYLDAIARRRGSLNPYHRAVLWLEERTFRLRSARHVVAISRSGKTEIERLYATPPDRVTVVYNGVDLDRFHPDNRERFGRSMRAELGLESATWVIVFVGSGFGRKGLGALLDGLSRLRGRDWALVVAGKGDVGPYREHAERLDVASRIRWLGPRRDVERLYAAADVVALPALYEPFGNVHLEALASGVPVLTSARAGGSETITQAANGWVVTEPSAHAVAEGLTALRQQAGPALAEAARRAVEPFTFAAEADGYERVYRELKR
jgi:UDP-glucose:(heptosyl)LPS alpha-1,3-glucosyltransferase